MENRILILGAGPTGLGAANRLKEKGYCNFRLYEKNSYVGGLAASFVDKKGFTWDIGGHVLFSKYKYINNLIDKLLKNDCLKHIRQCGIWMMNRWVAYPFQNNIKYLPPNAIIECLMDCLNLNDNIKSADFKNWLLNNFGEGICKYFLYPYNKKVWGWPLSDMNSSWIEERVSKVKFEELLRDVIGKKRNSNWGGNNMFKFPLFNGTGDLFNRYSELVKNYIELNSEIIRVDINTKKIFLNNGGVDHYDILINTIPLDLLIKNSNYDCSIKKSSENLKHNSCYVVGLGLRKKSVNNKSWMYFPEDSSPFYRTTNFSRYSPNNVPHGEITKYSSLMCETSFSSVKKVSKATIIQETKKGLLNTPLLDAKDLIVSEYLLDAPYAYPIPTVNRDQNLKYIQKKLMEYNIYSRGRFGAWKYEIGNMDHSIMQGIEIVDKILIKKEETVWTI